MRSDSDRHCRISVNGLPSSHVSCLHFDGVLASWVHVGLLNSCWEVWCTLVNQYLVGTCNWSHLTRLNIPTVKFAASFCERHSATRKKLYNTNMVPFFHFPCPCRSFLMGIIVVVATGSMDFWNHLPRLDLLWHQVALLWDPVALRCPLWGLLVEMQSSWCDDLIARGVSISLLNLKLYQVNIDSLATRKLTMCVSVHAKRSVEVWGHEFHEVH